MNVGEINDALLQGGGGETVSISGTANDIAEVMRIFKDEKIAIRGLVELDQSQYRGTNIHKVRLDDARGMFRVFNQFTMECNEITRRPIVDKVNNGIVATDGTSMLVCRIPNRFPMDDAEACGFSGSTAIRWKEIVDEMEPSDYNLASYCRMATIRKGDERHGLIQAIRDVVKVYEHTSEDGFFRTMRLKVGKKFYDARRVAALTDALFKLGCSIVAFCERTAFSGHIIGTYPLHLYGFGAEMDAKGVVMPIRYADDSTGAFTMPLDGAALQKRVA